MNIFQVSHKDLKVLFFIRPPFMVLMCYVFFGRSFFTEPLIFWPAALAALLTMLVTWRFHIYADHSLRKRFHLSQHTGKRLLLSVSFHFCIAAVFITGLFVAADTWHFLGYRFTWAGYFSGLFVGLCTNIAATGFHEGVYTFEKWKKAILEAEELKKLTLRNRLVVLRNQTNPHFFFNSINTLSGLIEMDTEKADRFLNEMCIVYRYLIKNDPEPFVPLQTELNFIRSWIYIVETRHGNAVSFQIEAESSCDAGYIPRLTLLAFLEFLLDKHIIDKHRRFTIRIRITDASIELSHPSHKKKEFVTEDKIQQVAAVRTMYRLLNMPSIIEQYANGQESISIPLHHFKPVAS